MITEPSCYTLITAVKKDLKEQISPEISSPEIKTTLAMIDSILGSVAIRVEHEVQWMQEEIERIEALALQFIDPSTDSSLSVTDISSVANALQILQKNKAQNGLLSDLRDKYNEAGEVLACLLEASMQSPQKTRKKIIDELAFRTRREVHIRGEYSLEGRT